MPRRPRRDDPDSWHHVMNRGTARRTLFETAEDERVFLALLASQVRAGRIEVHGYSLMLTHFHLLVRSPKGELSKALKQIQGEYSRWFNRRRRRDGPLFRGRFKSCVVETLRYRRNVLTYIHDNPICSAAASRASEHRGTSARHWSEPKMPRWLCQDWVQEELEARGGDGAPEEKLLRAFPTRTDPEFREWVERQLSQRLPDEDGDVTLAHTHSPKVVRWAIRKAKLADGTMPFQPVVRPAKAQRALAKIEVLVARAVQAPIRQLRLFAASLKAAVFRLCGETYRRIGHRVHRAESTICRDLKRHREALSASPTYEALAAEIIAQTSRP